LYRATCCAIFVSGALSASDACATPYLTLGPSDGIAVDQPRATVAIVDPATQQVLGPEFSNTFLLDTGANDILVGGDAYSELQDAGYQTVAQYDDFGIGGTATMDVSKAYEFDFAGDNGVPIALPNTRVLSNASADLGFDGVLGMPAMVGRTVNVDMTPWSGGNFDTLKTSFTSTAPPVVANQYHVPLSLVDFPPTGQHNPGDPLPTFAPLSMAPVVVQNQTHQLNGNFIVDTGAQISIISTATALALGIDPVKDAVDSLDLSGIAGTVNVPIVNVDSLGLKTSEGVNLMWTGLQVGVYDIDPNIAGVFGMDFLTSGWLNALLGGGPDGYLNGVHFDFRNAQNHAGTMVLDVNPTLSHVLVPGDTTQDGIVNGLDVNAIASHWLHMGSALPGDANGDGIVNGLDINLVASNWLAHVPGHGTGTAVPEPGTRTLAGTCCTVLWGLRWRTRRHGRTLTSGR
jgi:hypothetical protein